MKFQWKLAVVISCILVMTASVSIYFTHKRESNLSTFVITETGEFTSLDPLDGDSSENLPVARMLYATPVEIFSNNTLGSRVLDSFEYSKETKTISWKARSGVSYSDGTVLTAEDIAFSVVRMAFARPGFPLIKLIEGVPEWLKSQSPLKKYPTGIKVEGNTISIRLSEDYPHPLFRFCLELFSIIPKKCVDLETNKIICEKIPTSGYYELKENGGKSLIFQKRVEFGTIQGKKYPSQIKFLYRDATEAFDDPSLKSDETVILSSESKLSKEKIRQIQSQFEVGFTPAAWFTILQINPNVQPFNDPGCRIEFANAFRKNFEKISGEMAEGSVFTKLVPGYKSYDELLKSSQGKNQISKDRCAEKFKATRIHNAFGKTNPVTFVDTVTQTAKELGINISEPIEYIDRKEEVDNFISGKSALLYGRTGFWALDPTGDIQMLFTPNLHKGLQHFWTDSKLQNLLQSILRNGEVNMSSVEAINAYLFEDAKFNVYSHIRRFYASKNRDLVQHLPIGITSPSPWHLFGER